MKRVAIGKSVGFLFGLIGFICIPFWWPDVSWYLRFGILFWYPTVGAFIGLFGVMNYHPVLQIPLPWWFRSALIGGWMNLVLVLFAREDLRTFLARLFGETGAIQSPLWFILEGVILGLIMGYLATKFGGEGKATLDELPSAKN